ncbi:hypothetical protein PMAYCL1PPCAC_29809 [Pristionchus mayeri]|uniref:STAS domain-containing protein n=1 Tax=Pristionchus mayeri TaxID=1317129 RepID=A0AAN5DAS9_9BILA|nr:hypothetical protein PMAYCL1PPCAC_29809 [Pristionchus mayeri]
MTKVVPDESYKECATSEEVAVDGDKSADPESLVTEPRRRLGKRDVAAAAKSFLPILDWLPKYNIRENLHGDLIAGLTVGIMHVPQGMAYASLATVPPIVGLYSSFFSSSFYTFFGTSRHISIGCFAVASMMVGAVQMQLLPPPESNGTEPTAVGPLGDVTSLELTSALTLAVGIVQFVMALSRLGFVTAYLSDPLVSGFTTGAAVHVLMSQVNKVFGVKMPRHSGMGMIIYMVRDIVKEIPNTNLMALGISVFGIVFLSIGRDYVNPFVKKYSKIPVPLELILVIIGTVFSVVMNLKEDYHIKIVDIIPRGFPVPSPPRVSLLLSLLSDAIPIAIVCYIFIISMAKLFAKKHKYRIDSAQEMYACSFFSLLSSFFPVYPVGASLSRSAVCELSGAKTLLYTVFSSALLLTVILFLGPLLEPLPMCILACIVIVSLKSLFLQVKELPRLWKISKYDFAIWSIACLATVLCNVTQGLVIAVAFAIITVVLREQWPTFNDVSHSTVSPSQKIPEFAKVLKFDSPLHFANVTKFIDVLQATFSDESLPSEKVVIVDCSAISYIDSMGVDALKESYLDAKRADVSLFFVGFNDSIIQMLDNIDFFTTVPLSSFQTTVAEAGNHFMAK